MAATGHLREFPHTPGWRLRQVFRFRHRVVLRDSSRLVPGQTLTRRTTPWQHATGDRKFVSAHAFALSTIIPDHSRQIPVGFSAPPVALVTAMRCCAGADGLPPVCQTPLAYNWSVPYPGSMFRTAQANSPAGVGIYQNP